MPIYEFKCEECNSEFECIVFSSDSSVNCPECDTEKVKRQMSACSFKNGGNGGEFSSPSAGASSGCAGCASTNCSTCH